MQKKSLFVNSFYLLRLGKLSALFFLIFAFGFFLFPTYAHATSCEDVSFSDADICVSIYKISTTQFRVQTDITNQSSNTLAITCDLMTPDSVLRNVWSCNGTFSYTKRGNGTVVIYMTVNGEDRTIEKNYDFVDGDRTNASSNTSNTDLDNFYLTTDDSSPTISQWVDLTIKARDSNNSTVTDYTDMVNFAVYYRSSSSSSRTHTTSSSYYEIDSDYLNGYDFSSSDYGLVTLSNLIKFKKNNYDYKMRVYDDNDSSIYKELTFTVGNTSTSDEFTTSQILQIKTMYNMRPTLVTNLRQKYPSLKTNTLWQNQASALYIQMSAIIHWSLSIYANYDDFLQGFRDWYVYTLQVR